MKKCLIKTTCVDSRMKIYKRGEIMQLTEAEVAALDPKFYELVETAEITEQPAAPKKRAKKC